MAQNLTPSTQWRENVGADEVERFAGYGQQFVAIQARKSKKYGTGRALHRKQLMAATGTLEILGNLPEFACYGLFAAPATYDVSVRLSNGGLDRAADAVPDIRGFALRVTGVEGDSALGSGPATGQDFTLINQEVFSFSGSAEFVDFVVAASQGMGKLLKHLVAQYGILGGPLRLVSMLRTVGKPFGGFFSESFYSAVPIACGPYAVRLRLVPALTNGPAQPGAKKDWGADFNQKLAQTDLAWDLQLQPFVDEKRTPIEDASVNWASAYTTVARLRLARQDNATPEGKALAARIEKSVFDPWQALAAHRPLGDVQRARKVVYFESQKGRKAASS